MSKYYLYDLRVNSMIAGDWEWYLSTYDQRRSSSGAQQWARLRNRVFEVRAYDIPRTLNRFQINAVEFTPGCALRYGYTAIQSPPDVRWGMVLCLSDDFIKALGSDVFDKNFVGGRFWIETAS